MTCGVACGVTCRRGGTIGLTQSPGFRFREHLWIGGDPMNRGAGGIFDRPDKKLVGGDDGFISDALQALVLVRTVAPVEGAENLLTLAVGEGGDVFVRRGG